jgi:hypothetical protein
MSVAILCPLAGDTVASPVGVTVAYDFTSGACSLTGTVTGSLPSTVGPFSNASTASFSLPTTSTGPASASATASPISGGSGMTAFTIGSGGSTPPIIIETIDPILPPPPPPPPQGGTALRMAPVAAAAPGKNYKAKGSIKGTTIVQVKYRVLQVNLTTLAWTVVVPYTAANINGNNWNVNNIAFNTAANCQYSLQVEGYDATGGRVSQFTKAIIL